MKNIDSLKQLEWCNPSVNFPSPSNEQSRILQNTKQMYLTLESLLDQSELVAIFTVSFQMLLAMYVAYFRHENIQNEVFSVFY
jgi:hypothetical protein